MAQREPKPVKFNEAAKREFLDLPEAVIRDFGFYLFEAQKGLVPRNAKILKGFGGADVLELRESDAAGT